MLRLLTAIFVLFALPASAAEYIKTYIPTAKSVGAARMTVLFWDVYDGELYAPQGAFEDGKPVALRLSYLRSISGERIAARTMEEMRKQGLSDEVTLATWHRQLRAIFPNVEEGITLSGIYTPSGETVFYRNGARIGAVKDPEFGPAFFGIWLNEGTSQPEFRTALLGRP